VRDDKLTDTKKSGGASVRLAVAVAWWPPPVPVTVSANEPSGEDALVVTVRVDVPPPGSKLGENAAVAPVGRPPTASATGDVNSGFAVTTTV